MAAKSEQRTSSSFMIDFMMGGTAAAISKTAAAPIERVKLLIQNQGAMLSAGRLDRPYTGIVDCFRRTYAEEGVINFWRGNGTNVLRYFPTQALNFAFKDSFKKMFNFKKSEGFTLWVLGETDFHAARTRLSADNKSVTKGGQRQFNGLLDVYKKTLATDGIVGLYRGFVPSVGASLAAYPLDTIRRRMMMTSGEKVRYKSWMDAGRQIIAKEGARSLFSTCHLSVTLSYLQLAIKTEQVRISSAEWRVLEYLLYTISA
ncbi:hypothetical protein EIP86_009711 [Pleurotus ostreatoroseus]|nr:hypothetical protein EIP86_009711 [Pleurotus ostreatoroseus]